MPNSPKATHNSLQLGFPMINGNSDLRLTYPRHLTRNAYMSGQILNSSKSNLYIIFLFHFYLVESIDLLILINS